MARLMSASNVILVLATASCATLPGSDNGMTTTPPRKGWATEDPWSLVSKGMTKSQVYELLANPEHLSFSQMSPKETWGYPYRYDVGERRWVTFELGKVVAVVVAKGPPVFIEGVWIPLKTRRDDIGNQTRTRDSE